MAATIKQIAKLAGVAPTTVSLVLNGNPRIGEKTREHVLKIAADLDYYPNHSGRLLKQGRTDSVALLSSYFQNIFKMELVGGIEQGIFGTKYQLRQFLSQQGAESEKAKEILFGKMADAVILMSYLPEVSFMEKMRKSGKPVILVEETIPGHPGVEFDNYLAAYRAVEYLAKSGRKRIAISLGLKAYMGHRFVDDRLKGYIAAQRDLDLGYSNIIEMPNYTLEAGREIARELSGDRMPDALFCASGDMTAAGFLQETLSHGIRVPDDIAVVGFDDSIIARCTTPGLTTVRQPVQEMGKAALELALALVEETDSDAWERVVRFEPEIVVRQTA
jgi:DNA-binding LacI/PurR family transcriptional regulator